MVPQKQPATFLPSTSPPNPRPPPLTMCGGSILQSFGLGMKPTLPNSTWASEVKQKRAKSSAALRAAGDLVSSTLVTKASEHSMRTLGLGTT